MAACEACGRESSENAAYCGACGHRLGTQPQEPVIVELRTGRSTWDSFWGCLSTVAGVPALLFLAAWLFSC